MRMSERSVDIYICVIFNVDWLLSPSLLGWHNKYFSSVCLTGDIEISLLLIKTSRTAASQHTDVAS